MALSADQLNNLKETIRQRFDELYHRIGSNRQNLLNKVLFEHHQINKELAKETIDEAGEKEILRSVRDIERSADSQLPHVHKVVHPTGGSTPAAPAAPKPPKPEKPAKPAKPAKETKPKEVKVKVKSKPKAKPEAKAKTKAKPAKKKKK